jgi:hypothetical protein
MPIPARLPRRSPNVGQFLGAPKPAGAGGYSTQSWRGSVRPLAQSALCEGCLPVSLPFPLASHLPGRHTLPTYFRSISLKTKKSDTLRVTHNFDESFPCLPVSRLLFLRIKCHTLQSNFRSIPLKTNESDPHKVTHFFEGPSIRFARRRSGHSACATACGSKVGALCADPHWQGSKPCPSTGESVGPSGPRNGRRASIGLQPWPVDSRAVEGAPRHVRRRGWGRRGDAFLIASFVDRRIPDGGRISGHPIGRSKIDAGGGGMGKTYPAIEGAIKEFIEAQKVFFAGSAPLDAKGHVNISPKGLDTLRILGPRTVAYLDLTGSGIETVAHVNENGRIVLMFCAFQGPPKILRLHGRGRIVELHDAGFASLVSLFPVFDAMRSIIVVEVSDISDSCGYGVPLLHYEGEREQLGAWARQKGAEGIRTYQQENNRQSLDGLPGLTGYAPAVEQEGQAIRQNRKQD